MSHGLNSPYDGSILSLCKPIPLLVVWNNQLSLDSRLLAETFELLGGIVTPIVRSQDFDLLLSLVFD
jgi:hypothetical protein